MPTTYIRIRAPNVTQCDLIRQFRDTARDTRTIVLVWLRPEQAGVLTVIWEMKRWDMRAPKTSEYLKRRPVAPQKMKVDRWTVLRLDPAELNTNSEELRIKGLRRRRISHRQSGELRHEQAERQR
jgi:hypothetical protein